MEVVLADDEELGAFAPAFADASVAFFRLSSDRLLLSPNAKLFFGEGALPHTFLGLARYFSAADRQLLFRGLRSLSAGSAEEMTAILRFSAGGGRGGRVAEIRGRRVAPG